MKNYELIEETLRDMTPDPETFKDTIYPAEEVELDQDVLRILKERSGYKNKGERTKAKVLEKIFTDFAEQDDWFGEETLYADDPDWRAFSTIPTSEIDDIFQHIDMVATISNETTNHEVIPFAIDLTYNNQVDKMRGKFEWKHVYGKSESAPKEVSEFGQTPIGLPNRASNTKMGKRLPMGWRNGLKIPGFTAAKYFEDTNSIWDPALPKGRIEVMPRFVVGFNPEIAQILANGLPNQYETVMEYGKKAYNRKEREYNFAKASAKWCTLFELSRQAHNIKDFVALLPTQQTAEMPADELRTATNQINALSRYFSNALRAAKRTARDDPIEQEAIAYAKQDEVCRAILEQSEQTYQENSSKFYNLGSKTVRVYRAG